MCEIFGFNDFCYLRGALFSRPASAFRVQSWRNCCTCRPGIRRRNYFLKTSPFAWCKHLCTPCKKLWIMESTCTNRCRPLVPPRRPTYNNNTTQEFGPVMRNRAGPHPSKHACSEGRSHQDATNILSGTSILLLQLYPVDARYRGCSRTLFGGSFFLGDGLEGQAVASFKAEMAILRSASAFAVRSIYHLATGRQAKHAGGETSISHSFNADSTLGHERIQGKAMPPCSPPCEYSFARSRRTRHSAERLAGVGPFQCPPTHGW